MRFNSRIFVFLLVALPLLHGCNLSLDEEASSDGAGAGNDEIVDDVSSDNSTADDGALVDRIDVDYEEPAVAGATFYIDPVHGSDNGDGSINNPWKTLEQVISSGQIEFYKHSENYNPDSEWVVVNDGAPVKGGDQLVLLSGYHGYLRLSNFMFQDWLHIVAGEGETPVLSQIFLYGAFEKVRFEGLTIMKDAYQPPSDATTEEEQNYWDAEAINRNSGANVYLGSNGFWGAGESVILQNLTMGTTGNSSIWTKDDWVEKAASGIQLRAVKNVDIIGNTILNTSFGISIGKYSDGTRVIGNHVKNFSGDGARLLSDNTLFENNRISDCYDVDANHDDGIQSWSIGDDNRSGTGVVKNVIVRGNTIIGTTDFDNPLAGPLQGIGAFDGLFEGWVVENNVIATNHYHGISFYGMLDSRISHNTVVDIIPGDDLSPWVRVVPHKNGTESEDVIVVNNIAQRAVTVEGSSMVEEANYVIGSTDFATLDELFVDPSEFDYRPLDSYTANLYINGQGATAYEGTRQTLGAMEP